MALLTDEQLHAIRELIRDHHSAFVVNTIGPEAVPQDILEKLQELGLVDIEITSIEDAYLYGRAMAVASDPKLAHMSLQEFKQYIRQNPIPLSDAERRSIDFAKHQAAQFVVGLGNRIDTQTGQLLIEADAALRAQRRREIRTATAEAIERRKAVKQLVSDLKWKTRDWTRDWDRIAITEKHNAMQRGVADGILKHYGDGARVAKRPTPDACEHCKRLYLGPDGQPRIFRLVDLERNGTNFGRKVRDWLPVVGATHPHCHPPGTMVETVSGPKSIEHVIPGDRVLTHLGTWEPVTHTWESGFHGYLVEVATKGRRLEATPSHPLLTPDGWRPAESLREGTQLQSPVTEINRPSLVDVNAADTPPPSVERAQLVPVLFGFTRGGVPITAVYFDGQLYLGEREVNQPGSNRESDSTGNADGHQGVVDEAFVGRFELTSLGLRQLDAGLSGDDTSAGGPVRSHSQPLLFRPIQGLHAEFVGLGSVTLGDPGPLESENDSVASNTEMAGYLLHRRSLVRVHVHNDSTIEFAPVSSVTIVHDRPLFDYVGIVNVRLNHYCGPVYNLTVARANSYVANGIVSHNCQCQLVRVPEGWGYDVDGDLIPGGEYGERVENMEQLQLSLAAQDELYKAFELQGHTKFQGIPIAIENRIGSVRRWTNEATGEAGETRMRAIYGYVKRTGGADGEEIDVYVGPDALAGTAFIVHQLDAATGRYDEDKVILGASSAEQAKAIYQAHIDDPRMFGCMSSMDIDQFKRWCGYTEDREGHGAHKMIIPLEKALTVSGKVATEFGAQTSPAAHRAPGHGTFPNLVIPAKLARTPPPPNPMLHHDPNVGTEERLHVDPDMYVIGTPPAITGGPFDRLRDSYYRGKGWPIVQIPVPPQADAADMRGQAIFPGRSGDIVALNESHGWHPQNEPGIDETHRIELKDAEDVYSSLEQVRQRPVLPVGEGVAPYTDAKHKATERAERQRLERQAVANRQRPRNTVDVEQG